MNTSSKVLFLFFALCVAASLQHSHTHECSHDEIQQNPEFVDVQEEVTALEDGRLLASENNIRIYPYFDILKLTSASSSYIAYIQNELVPPIVDYFQSALKIKYPVSGNLKLSTSVTKICERNTPAILTTTGVAADFFIYFDSEEISGTQIASSKYCSLASGTRRPLIARTMINRNMLAEAKGNVIIHEQNMYVIMHEMMHTLGFSESLYKYFIDENGKTRTGHIKTTKINGSSRNLIDLPPLTNRLRTFFGCSSLEGAVMENSGGSGTASSHFERQYFIYETMSSGSILGRRVSEFSLAMLEGSGWYTPDYSYAEPYFFGQGQGCSFLNTKCSSTAPKFEEYCAGSNRGCAPHGRGGGYCSSDSVSDGCKYNYPDEDYDCENPDGEDFARLPDLQVYGRGAGSKCFSGDLNTRKSNNGRSSFCFKYTCVGSGDSTQLEVQVGSNKVTCTKAEQRSIDGFYGTIDCPDPLTFCNTVGKKYCPRNCMGRGSCVNNQCHCNAGFTGVDCALKV